MVQYLLSVEQMRAAEQYMFTQGTESYALMRRAGAAVAECIDQRYPGRPVLVLAGPGNNGGDGFIAAQALAGWGRAVVLAFLGDVSKLRGGAAAAAAQFKGMVVSLKDISLADDPVVVDALFGTGLTRAIEGDAADMLRAVRDHSLDVVAVDIPSGIHGDTGEVLGIAAVADITVTFAAKKYGHVLMPGRALCGEIIIADIGIDQEALESVKPAVLENAPALWLAHFPWPKPETNKYNRGATLVIGGPVAHAGAARLAALAALRTGSGLVSIVCDKKDEAVYASEALSLITDTLDNWHKLLEDKRNNTVLIGPGAGVNDTTCHHVLAALEAGKRTVLDADALSAFASKPEMLFGAIKSPCILTPHTGEFARLFPEIAKGQGNKLQKTLRAAQASHAVVVLKGYDTVIAAPDGRVVVNTNAPPSLATAGAGDVLGGICAGLLAPGMEAFEAACAAVWIHGEAAQQQGVGLIAEDLLSHLPSALQSLKSKI